MNAYPSRRRRSAAAAALVVALLSAALGAWLASGDGAGERAARAHEREHGRVPAVDAAGQTYYTCSMHPEVRQAQPGNCPICGMQLIERSTPAAAAPGAEDAGSGHHGAGSDLVRIDPAMAQNLGMRTATVVRDTFWQRVDASGAVAIDERRIRVIESRSAGWVEHLAVRAEGEAVAENQLLATLYAPELYAARQELALAQRSGDAELIDAAAQRLRLLGGGPGQGSGSAVRAPQAGHVIELSVREGAQVAPGAPLMTLADLSRVWVLVEVPEAQAGWVREGRPAEARLPAYPGRVFEGEVEFVYPTLDPDTRTQRLRLSFDNADGALRPGMFAEVTVFGGARRDVLLVPTEALIRTGRREVVIVALGAGRYRPTEIVAGAERAGRTEVRAGLAAGDEVVVSGQFLIDSEASLQGVYRRMAPATPMPDAHDGHEAHGADAQSATEGPGGDEIHGAPDAHGAHAADGAAGAQDAAGDGGAER